MKIKTTTEDVIETTKFMINQVENPAAIIEGICQSHILTDDFIREFRSYITPEMFMLSYKLSKNMAERYPDLYNEYSFKDLMKTKYVTVEGSGAKKTANARQQQLNAQIMMTQMQNGATTISNSQLQQIVNGLGSVPEEEDDVIPVSYLGNISISMLAEFLDYFRDNYNEYSTFEDEEETKEFVSNIIREATQDEIADTNMLAFMGISNEIDELLLKRIKDEDTRNALLLLVTTSDEHAMTASTYKYLGNDMKEDLLGTENVSVREFINALADTKDLGWQIKMIDKAVNGEIILEKTRDCYDKEIVLLLSKLPESEIAKFTNLYSIMPNTLSYKALSWCLTNKDFSEKDLIEMKDALKQAGLWFDLMKIARENNYENLKNAMRK